MGRWNRWLATAATAAAFFVVAGISFVAGRASAIPDVPSRGAEATLSPVQAPLQEVIPLRPPTGGDRTPGQLPVPPVAGDQCQPRFVLFHNGRFYEMRPGPGQGMRPGPGRPGALQELIPLQPGQGINPGPGTPGPGLGTLPAVPPKLSPETPTQRF